MTLVRFVELLALTLGAIALVSIPLAFFFLSQARRREQEAIDAAGRSVEFTKDMMGMVAHDLRGPLQTIVGLSETLRDRWRHLPDEEVDSALDTVSSQGRRLVRACRRPDGHPRRRDGPAEGGAGRDGPGAAGAPSGGDGLWR